ncbi:hypothetical protein GCM10027052_12470 [Parafrigoribacterium mesophilum]|uniref:hypothetical protein n=1 Tax=Parafrigoribacterium mesophilum TaxID=433646 RepID=UPI0031FD89B0
MTRPIRHRAAIALGLALFLVLAGTGTSLALFSAKATSSWTVTAGRIAVTQSGFPSLGHTFSQAAPTATGQVAVTNSGDFNAPYTARLTADSSALAPAIVVDAWPKSAGDDCTIPAPGATSGTLAAMPALTGSLAPGNSATYCLRAGLNPVSLTANSNSAASATLTVTSGLGSWAATAVDTATLTVGDTVPPTVPGTPVAVSTTQGSISLIWAGSRDDVAVSGYDVFRDGVLIASVSSASYTDNTTIAKIPYRYTVMARDAAGNVSALSAALTATTDQLTGYQVRYADGMLCVGAPILTDGAALAVSPCDLPVTKKNQAWLFIPNGDGAFTVQPVQGQNLNWKVNGSDFATVFRQNAPGPGWIVDPVGAAGNYHFVSATSGQCLTVTVALPVSLLVQQPCGTSSTQLFTLTEVP